MPGDIRSCERYKALGPSDLDELVGELMDFVQTKKPKLDNINSGCI